jgi:hypothetical protein
MQRGGGTEVEPIADDMESLKLALSFLDGDPAGEWPVPHLGLRQGRKQSGLVRLWTLFPAADSGAFA